MKVKEFIEELSKCNPAALVVIPATDHTPSHRYYRATLVKWKVKVKECIANVCGHSSLHTHYEEPGIDYNAPENVDVVMIYSPGNH